MLLGIVVCVVYLAGLIALQKASGVPYVAIADSEPNLRKGVLIPVAVMTAVLVAFLAGLVARRIRCDARAGQQVLAGQRVGLIRFGSRVDVYLPAGVAPLVAVGQKAVAGETILADATSSETARRGEAR